MQLGSSLRRRRTRGEPAESDRFRLSHGRLGVLILALALVGLGFGYLFATRVLFPAPPPPGDLYEVPDVRGLGVERAGSTLDEAGLSLGAVEFLRHPVVDSGTVVGQAPLPGQLAAPNTAVRVTLSLGPERQPVPDLVGLRGDWAANVLQSTGFRVEVDSTEAMEPRGRVLGIEPDPGTELALPGEVRLQVSMGPPQVAMPDLVGMREEEARDTLSVLGLAVGDVGEVFRFGRDQGVVVQQAPPADSLVERGSVVTLSVGRRGRGGAVRDTTDGGDTSDGREGEGGSGGNKRPRQP